MACIHNAPSGFKASLVEMVGDKSPSEIADILAKPDVQITSLKDKDLMLPIIRETDSHVRDIFKQVAGIAQAAGEKAEVAGPKTLDTAADDNGTGKTTEA